MNACLMVAVSFSVCFAEGNYSVRIDCLDLESAFDLLLSFAVNAVSCDVNPIVF
jgi:hypothetical protein